MTKCKMSPGLAFVDLMWGYKCGAIPHSWRIINQVLRQSLHLAIRGGLRFEPRDFHHMAEHYRIGYWFSDDGGEQFYRTAVEAENLSACEAFETWKGRGPIIADDVQSKNWINGHINRQRCRLAVGLTFRYGDHEPIVTSFDSKGAAVACTYQPKPERVTCEQCGGIDWRKSPERSAKITRRFRVTAEDIQADRKERKAVLAELKEKARATDG